MDLKQLQKMKNLRDIRKYSYKTILSLLFILAGFLFYLYWGITFGVWADIGIYSVTALFVIGGFLGLLLSVMEEPKKD